MYLSIRDEVVLAAGYTTLAEGLQDLGISGIELFVLRDDTVSALVPEDGKDHLKLTDEADMAALEAQAASVGARISALCMGNDFNASDRKAEIDWAVRTV